MVRRQGWLGGRQGAGHVRCRSLGKVGMCRCVVLTCLRRLVLVSSYRHPPFGLELAFRCICAPGAEPSSVLTLAALFSHPPAHSVCLLTVSVPATRMAPILIPTAPSPSLIFPQVELSSDPQAALKDLAKEVLPRVPQGGGPKVRRVRQGD